MRTVRPPRTMRVRSGCRATRQDSQGHHQLADRLAIAKLGDRFAGALQGIGCADFRRDSPLLPPAEQLLHVLGIALRLAREKAAPEHAANVTALEESEVQRELCNTRREADDEEATLPGDAAQCRLAIIAANGVENDVRAGRPDRFLELLSKLLLPIPV